MCYLVSINCGRISSLAKRWIWMKYDRPTLLNWYIRAKPWFDVDILQSPVVGCENIPQSFCHTKIWNVQIFKWIRCSFIGCCSFFSPGRRQVLFQIQRMEQMLFSRERKTSTSNIDGDLKEVAKKVWSFLMWTRWINFRNDERVQFLFLLDIWFNVYV